MTRKTILGSLIFAGVAAVAAYWLQRSVTVLADSLGDDYYKDMW